ncbi:histidine phosphatase family protein [Micrococcales bacterium 31B]|nr:histidine phosphatase family protein [Micrococcales bacterium 31B]
MTRIHIWRHGQTDHNAQLRVQGTVDVPLNERGLEQARVGAAALGQFKVRKIVTSPLLRAAATATALTEVTGIAAENESLLRERAYGSWEGLTHDEILAAHPEQFKRWLAGYDPEGVGVETRAAVGERFVQAVVRHVLEPGATDVVLVCHGGIAVAGMVALLGQDPSNSPWFGPLDNCRWATMQLRSGGAWRINEFNVGA